MILLLEFCSKCRPDSTNLILLSRHGSVGLGGGGDECASFVAILYQCLTREVRTEACSVREFVNRLHQDKTFSQKIYFVCLSSQRSFVFLASAGDCQIFNVIVTEVSKFEQTEEIFL